MVQSDSPEWQSWLPLLRMTLDNLQNFEPPSLPVKWVNDTCFPEL